MRGACFFRRPSLMSMIDASRMVGVQIGFWLCLVRKRTGNLLDFRRKGFNGPKLTTCPKDLDMSSRTIDLSESKFRVAIVPMVPI